MKKWMAFLAGAILMLSSCGGGGGDSGSTPATPSTNGSISGTVTEGPVSGATVTAWSLNTNGARGNQIGSGQTDANGNFSISMGTHSGPFMLQVSGGTYRDEATGTQMSMGNNVMTCMMPQMSAGSPVNGIQVTALTSMAQMMAQNMPGGMNQANITRANSAVGNYFGVSDITMVHPMDPTMNGSGAGSTQDMRNYGMSMAAMSQYAKEIGMPQSSGMITAMMNDASDGRMDGMMSGSTGMGSGMMGSTQVQMGGGMGSGTPMQSNAGTRGMADGMTHFISSPMNKSGLNLQDMRSLIDKLSASNGQIQ